MPATNVPVGSLRYWGQVLRTQYGRAGGQKIFGIGYNKTGTTSLAGAMRAFGFRVGRQRTAEKLLDDWECGEFRRIVAYCRTAEFFQDVPFSLVGTYRVLDTAFPGSRFVLTVRDDPDQWYRSLVRFHSETFGGGALPAEADLEASDYVEPGWSLRAYRALNGPGELYHAETLKTRYQAHNQAVRAYFRDRKHQLLELNVATPGALQRLAEFVDAPTAMQARLHDFPHLNRSGRLT